MKRPYDPAIPRFHGRRFSRPLRQARVQAMDLDLPRFSLPAGPEPLDPRHITLPGGAPPEAVWMEIGFGSGEHLLGLCRQHPQILLLGAEAYQPGVAACLKQRREMAPEAPENLRLWPEDVRLLLPRLPDGCLERIYVLFPDPWPKRRHWERRLIGRDQALPEIIRLLAPGGLLILATDHPGLADWMLQECRAMPDLTWTAAEAADWREAPAGWIRTRYQIKTEAEGRNALFFIFRRGLRAD